MDGRASGKRAPDTLFAEIVAVGGRDDTAGADLHQALAGIIGIGVSRASDGCVGIKVATGPISQIAFRCRRGILCLHQAVTRACGDFIVGRGRAANRQIVTDTVAGGIPRVSFLPPWSRRIAETAGVSQRHVDGAACRRIVIDFAQTAVVVILVAEVEQGRGPVLHLSPGQPVIRIIGPRERQPVTVGQAFERTEWLIGQRCCNIGYCARSAWLGGHCRNQPVIVARKGDDATRWQGHLCNLVVGVVAINDIISQPLDVLGILGDAAKHVIGKGGRSRLLANAGQTTVALVARCDTVIGVGNGLASGTGISFAE